MKIKLLLLCCIVLLTTSCATTKVINTWKEDSQTEKFTTIFVFGLAKQPVYRSLLERQLVNFLKDAGVDAHTTYDLFPDISSIDKAAAAAVIKNKGGDGVIVVRLIDKNEETLYLRGKTVYLGGVAVRDSSGWHSYYDTVSAPDFVVDQKMAMVETVIFNVDTEKPVWSAITKTTETSIPDIIYSYRKAIGKQLKSSGLF
jgi:hypothetical protein